MEMHRKLSVIYLTLFRSLVSLQMGVGSGEVA